MLYEVRCCYNKVSAFAKMVQNTSVFSQRRLLLRHGRTIVITLRLDFYWGVCLVTMPCITEVLPAIMNVRYWVALLLLPGISLAADLPYLGGDWRYDAQQSDDVPELISQRLKVLNRTGIRVINTSRGPVTLGRFRQLSQSEQINIIIELIDIAVSLEPLVEVLHQEPLMRLTYANDRVREVYTDGRDLATTVQSTANLAQQQLMFAAWEEDALVIETNTNSGAKILEYYRLDTDKQRLLVDVSIDSSKMPRVLEYQRVYRRPDAE